MGELQWRRKSNSTEDYSRTMYSWGRDAAASVRSEEWFKGRHRVSEVPHRRRNIGWGRRLRLEVDSRVCWKVRVTTYELCVTCITVYSRKKPFCGQVCSGRFLESPHFARSGTPRSKNVGWRTFVRTIFL